MRGAVGLRAGPDTWRERIPLEAAVGQGGLLVLLVATAAFVALPALTRPALTVAMVITFGVLAVMRPHPALLGLLVWLLALGSLRRIATGVSPAGETDLLLLVGPIALTSVLVTTRPLRAHLAPTPLSRAVLVLSALVFVSAFNPAQGSLVGGVAGLLFTFVPTLAFWIGRSLSDVVWRRLLQLVMGGGIVASGYGLFQQFVGFPSWDQRWIEEDGYLSLNIGKDITRAFAMFSSSQEYAAVLTVALVLVGIFFARRLPLFLAGGGFVAVTLLLAAARTPVVMVLATAGLLAATRLRLPLPLVVAVGFASFVLVFVGAGYLARSAAPSGAAAPFVDRQLEGLANPLDAEKSTASEHYGYFARGISSAFTNPVGKGLGVISVAGSKFDGTTQLTEYDASNMAVAVGLPGLVAYLAVAFLGLRQVFRLARARPDHVRLAALGVIVVLFNQWLNGGLYAISLLPWLALGWADAQPEPGGEVESGARSFEVVQA